MVKNFLTSKTIWFGIAQVVFSGVGYFTGWMPADTATALFITGMGTLGLRFKTSTPITLSSGVKN